MRAICFLIVISSYLSSVGVSKAQPTTHSKASEWIQASKKQGQDQQVIKTRGMMSRAGLTRVVKGGVPQLLAQTHLAPVRRDGRFIGFQLKVIRPGSIAQEAGFIKNDIIMSVNDEPIGRPEQMMHALSLLPFAQTLVIQFERRGTVKEWTWLIEG